MVLLRFTQEGFSEAGIWNRWWSEVQTVSGPQVLAHSFKMGGSVGVQSCPTGRQLKSYRWAETFIGDCVFSHLLQNVIAGQNTKWIIRFRHFREWYCFALEPRNKRHLYWAFDIQLSQSVECPLKWTINNPLSIIKVSLTRKKMERLQKYFSFIHQNIDSIT